MDAFAEAPVGARVQPAAPRLLPLPSHNVASDAGAGRPTSVRGEGELTISRILYDL